MWQFVTTTDLFCQKGICRCLLTLRVGVITTTVTLTTVEFCLISGSYMTLADCVKPEDFTPPPLYGRRNPCVPWKSFQRPPATALIHDFATNTKNIKVKLNTLVWTMEQCLEMHACRYASLSQYGRRRKWQHHTLKEATCVKGFCCLLNVSTISKY